MSYSEIHDAQRMMKSAPASDVEKFQDAEAMAERIREWLDTPEGTMAHHPSWGHNLLQFKHDPLSEYGNLDVLIEMEIAVKLPIDIEDIILVGVDVKILDIDLCRVDIWHQFGKTTTEVSL